MLALWNKTFLIQFYLQKTWLKWVRISSLMKDQFYANSSMTVEQILHSKCHRYAYSLTDRYYIFIIQCLRLLGLIWCGSGAVLWTNMDTYFSSSTLFWFLWLTLKKQKISFSEICMLKKVCQIFFLGGDVWIFWDTQNDLPLVIFFSMFSCWHWFFERRILHIMFHFSTSIITFLL